MLYIVSVLKQNIYSVYDTCSGSIMSLQKEPLSRIMNTNKMQVINAQIKNNGLFIRDWETGTYTNENEFIENDFATKRKRTKYILIATGNNLYKIVEPGKLIYDIDSIQFESIVKLGKIAIPKDIHKIHKNEEFEKQISEKYQNFLAKTMLLGCRDMTFKYEIENKEVRLKNYTGKNPKVILPSFITAIMEGACRDKNIETISLNNGLKIIDREAFCNTGVLRGITHIEIPETVELIGRHAFTGNRSIVRYDGKINIDKFKLLNEETIVLTQ